MFSSSFLGLPLRYRISRLGKNQSCLMVHKLWQAHYVVISSRQFNHELIQSISIRKNSNHFLNQHGHLFIRTGPNRIQKAILSLTLINQSGQTGVRVWLSPSAPNRHGQFVRRCSMVISILQVLKHEALQTWYTPNMKPFK